MHGFDEFFGNLYHLNAEEEPENPDYPKDPGFRKKFGPRGVLRCKATDKDDTTIDPQFGKVGKQTIENTGPLTRKRMETVDEEFLASASISWSARRRKAALVLLLQHDPHARLDPPQAVIEGRRAWRLSRRHGGLDGSSASCSKKLDELGVADNTIVVFTTDNGAEKPSWPDGGTSPFRGEKNTSWEGGWRVPFLMSWPGVIKPGTVTNEIRLP